MNRFAKQGSVVSVEWKGQTIGIFDDMQTADTFIDWYSENCVVGTENDKKDFTKTERAILTLKERPL